MFLNVNRSLRFGNRSVLHCWHINDQEINAIESFILKVNELYPKWQEEWAPIAEECDLFFNNRDSIERTIRDLLTEKLKNSSFEYFLTYKAFEIILNIKLQHNRQLAVAIPYDNYEEILKSIPNEIGETVKGLNKVNYKVNVTTEKKNADWIK